MTNNEICGIIVAIFGLFGFCSVIWDLYKSIYSWFDHCSWNDDAVPDINAHVIDVQSNEVSYSKNGAKFETIVVFSDGFVFKTYKTKRKNDLFTYTISIDQQLLDEIISAAKRKHIEAIRMRKS